MASGRRNRVSAVFWAGIVLGFIASVVAAELVDFGSWCAPRIVDAAARRMTDPELVKRYQEEWKAELAAYDGLKLIKLGKALSILFFAARIQREMGGERLTLTDYLATMARLIRSEMSRVVEAGPGQSSYRGHLLIVQMRLFGMPVRDFDVVWKDDHIQQINYKEKSVSRVVTLVHVWVARFASLLVLVVCAVANRLTLRQAFEYYKASFHNYKIWL
jgi:hypothetical protein